MRTTTTTRTISPFVILRFSFACFFAWSPRFFREFFVSLFSFSLVFRQWKVRAAAAKCVAAVGMVPGTDASAE